MPYFLSQLSSILRKINYGVILVDDAVPILFNGFPDVVVIAAFLPFARVYDKDVNVVLFATSPPPETAKAYSG